LQAQWRSIQLKGNLKTVLADKLDPHQLKSIYKTFDIVGSIAIIRVPEKLHNHSRLIAEAIMDIHREVKSVWRQISSVSGDYRLRRLEHILGEKTTETIHKEHGCVYKTDIKRAYFSPRLSFERLRIAELIKKGETVLNMFAGVGCYSISIANHAEPLKVISIDVNPIAFHYLVENIRLNRAEKKVVPFQGDAKNIVENKLQNTVDRVLMPLPERAYEYLDYALYALKPNGGWIHYYDFEHANKNEDPLDKAKKKVSEKLRELCWDFHVKFGRIVRTIGPRWFQVVLDIQLQK
jgi:tRNA (guanine37-N1)-methyltransferase